MKQERSKMSLEDVKSSPFQRHRNILHLIAQYLDDFGMKQSKSALLAEACLSSDRRVCDNIDLDTIYLDFCSYYHLKFGKQPKFVRQIDETTVNDVTSNQKPKNGKNKGSTGKCSSVASSSDSKGIPEEVIPNDFTLAGSCIRDIGGSEKDTGDVEFSPKFWVQKNFNLVEQFVGEMKELASIIERDIVKSDCKIKWDDVQGNDHVKQILQEAVLLPLTYPHLFTKLTQPWKGILLHGVSGVGKTLLVKALSSETFGSVTFFNISASTLISKWRGESEKFLKVLFTMAKNCAPSIIFIDEFESLASCRDSSKDHEATKRFKNEFLIQIDELDSTDGNVLLLANSNLPWEVDVAFLRRFERKVLVDMPNEKCRAKIVQNFLPNSRTWSEEHLCELVRLSDGLTGADLKTACKEASMKQIRKIIQSKNLDLKPEINFEDLKTAVEQLKPIMNDLAEKHRKWNTKNGNFLN